MSNFLGTISTVYEVGTFVYRLSKLESLEGEDVSNLVSQGLPVGLMVSRQAPGKLFSERFKA